MLISRKVTNFYEVPIFYDSKIRYLPKFGSPSTLRPLIHKPALSSRCQEWFGLMQNASKLMSDDHNITCFELVCFLYYAKARIIRTKRKVYFLLHRVEKIFFSRWNLQKPYFATPLEWNATDFSDWLILRHHPTLMSLIYNV